MNYLIDLIIAWWRYDEWHPVHNRVNAYFTKAIELGVTDITYTKFTQIVIHYNGGVITAWDSHGSRSGGWLADGEVHDDEGNLLCCWNNKMPTRLTRLYIERMIVVVEKDRMEAAFTKKKNDDKMKFRRTKELATDIEVSLIQHKKRKAEKNAGDVQK